MIVKIISSTIISIDSYPVDVEVDISPGLPQFSTVGLPDAAVKESKDRIKAAIKNSCYKFPRNHVTVNLARADIKKEGTGFDLPIAVSILIGEGCIEAKDITDYLFIGELSLDGSVKGVDGVLPAALMAKEMRTKGMIVVRENAAEEALVESVNVVPVDTLSEVVEHFNGKKEIEPLKLDIEDIFDKSLKYPFDFSEIRSHEHAKRALEVAAAGVII